MDDQITWYLRNAGRIPLLTPSEEIELGHAVQAWMAEKEKENPSKRICRRGKKAYDRMFKANLRLVVEIARKYTKSVELMQFEDLISEGNLGLSRAVEKFDPARGYKFSTYAYWWIRQGVRRAMSIQDRSIRLPINCLEVQAKIARFRDDFKFEHGRNPTIKECSDFSDTRPVTLRAYLAHVQRPMSLDEKKKELSTGRFGQEMTYLDLVADPEENPSEFVETDDSACKLLKLLKTLPARESTVLKYRYGLSEQSKYVQGDLIDINKDGLTFTEIGQIMGLTRERVRQIEANALKRLKQRLDKSSS